MILIIILLVLFVVPVLLAYKLRSMGGDSDILGVIAIVAMNSIGIGIILWKYGNIELDLFMEFPETKFPIYAIITMFIAGILSLLEIFNITKD